MPLFVLCYLAVAGAAVKSAPAQDSDIYDAAPASLSTRPVEPPVQREHDASMDIDDLEALLPDHLRTPLPLSDAPVATPPDFEDSKKETAASPIEVFYREATSDSRIRQYGYDFLSGNINAVAPSAGEVQDDYVLGPGDRVTISFLGERKDRNSYVIDRAGSLTIDQLPPIAASGKTLGNLRETIQHMMEAQSYHGEIYASLEHVRQIGILVVGNVVRPGRHAMTPLQTVLEALEQSGGVTTAGSLRQIRLVRGGESTPVDLYAVMNGTDTHPLPTLRDGDRIIVPPLGPTLAVTGDVRQPAIYELPISGQMPVMAALQLAGGPLSRGQNRVILQTPQADGQRTAQPIVATSRVNVIDGAIINVERTQDRSAASFTLSGETRSPGTYPLSQYSKISGLLRRPQMYGDDMYPLIGVISRRRDSDLTRDLVAFSPQDVFAGRADEHLQDGDNIRLFARAEIEAIMKNKSVDGLSPLIATFVHEHAVSLQGAVRLPGLWPVAGSIAVARALDVAGGALSDADLSRTEISRNDVGLITVSMGAVSRRDVVDLSAGNAEGVTITFGDAIRIPDRFEAVTRQNVTLHGEVRNPGTYDLMRGDTLLSLIDRAGGLTDEAYPLGTVFSRAAERRREKEKFNVAAHDLERSIAVAADDKDGKVNMEQMAMAKDLVDELKTIEPVGRITVESDPAILRRDPAQDILLEAGDTIYIPKRPLSVRVTGEVLSSAALQFRSDKSTRDYISEAGGFTMNADKSRIFVLYPNGSAQPISAGSWTRMKPLMITPGSTVVVPRDPKPFDFMQSAKDITQILSNLAITGIYANDLVDRAHDE